MSSQLQRNYFNQLLTLITLIELHNILNPEHFGFRPNARTTDSLFILRQLLHKYTKQNKKLYVSFIDYEKAFDSVWQFGMIQKLHKSGIQGRPSRKIPECHISPCIPQLRVVKILNMRMKLYKLLRNNHI